jgi:hypothetical protein
MKGTNVNLHKPLALSLALVTLLGLTAAGASAQSITKATFTLPAQAYWNSVAMPAGEYSLSLDRSVSGLEIIYLRGEGVKAVFFSPAGSEESSGRSCLKIEQINGTYVVREFDEGPLGRAHRFGVSKTVKEMTLRGSTAQPITVPVAGL